MKTDNLIKLKSWRVETDKHGSEFKKLDDDIIAYELKKPNPQNNNKIIYNNVRIFLNHFFNIKYFNIPKFKYFKITYKTYGKNKLYFTIEENEKTYNFYSILPPSKQWTTKIIHVEDFRYDSNEELKLNLNKITGFIFSFYSSIKDEIIDTLYIKEFVIKGYEIITLKNKVSGCYIYHFLEKKFLNNLKLFLFNKKQNPKIVDQEGNPLYCIYPFYQFRIAVNYITVCCDIFVDENVDFTKNKNLIDIWHCDRFDEIRESMKNLSYSKCDLKRCNQFNTTKESFKNLKTIKKEYPEVYKYIEGKTDKFRGLPGYIVAGFDNKCNLNCRSCTVSSIKNQSLEINQKYINQIEDIGKYIEKLSLASYGDPFASPIYRNWLNNFPSEKFPKLKTIEIMTNGLLWTEENWNNIPDSVKNKYILATISIDGATKETYEYNRGNAKFEKLINNLDYISKLRKKKEVNIISLCFVVQQNNYEEIPLMIEFAKKYSFDAVSFNQITNWGSYTNEEFSKVNIFNKKHPEYNNFKNIYEEVKALNIDDIIIEFRFKL